MIKSLIEYVVISDIHVLHRKTPTKHILENLVSFFGDFKRKPFEDLSVIFIAGDFFDRSVMFYQLDVRLVTIFLSRLIHYCKDFGISLRVLEGTPSHDWRQCEEINNIKANIPGADVRYVDSLSIETFPNGMTVLYVPDEWSHSCSDTQQQVSDLLVQHGLRTVDIAMMHGVFAYQVPEIAHADTHGESFYLSIVDRYINIGHHHVHTTFDRIIAQGSFDRLRHGEEEPKGGTRNRIFPDKRNDTWEFIENKKAMPYVTVDIKNESIDKALSKIDKTANKLTHGFLRVRAPSGHSINATFHQIKEMHPHLTLERDVVSVPSKSGSKDIIGIDESLLSYTPVHIRQDNVLALLNEAMSKHGLSAKLKETAERHIKDIM